MDILQSFIIGIVSGFAELLPISGETHRAILRFLMGIDAQAAITKLILHTASLAALLWCSKEELLRIRKTQALRKIPRKKRRRQPDMPTVYTIRLLKAAGILLILGRIFTMQLSFVGNELQILAFTTFANGVLLLIPSFVRNGNKDSRNMPRLDGLLMGLGAGLSVIPGISQVGASVSLGIARGVDKKYALKFAYLLLIPGLLLHIIFDIIAVVTDGAVLAGIGIGVVIASAAASYIGSYLGYKFMNFLAFSTNFSAFGYYCFGVGLFSFVLFLTI